jgi:hypothetical protein
MRVGSPGPRRVPDAASLYRLPLRDSRSASSPKAGSPQSGRATMTLRAAGTFAFVSYPRGISSSISDLSPSSGKAGRVVGMVGCPNGHPLFSARGVLALPWGPIWQGQVQLSFLIPYLMQCQVVGCQSDQNQLHGLASSSTCDHEVLTASLR